MAIKKRKVYELGSEKLKEDLYLRRKARCNGLSLDFPTFTSGCRRWVCY
jgi:hypothetical protein